MNFSDANKVASVIAIMKNAEIERSPQRALLNDFFNGKPLWTEQEARDNRITVNFNDKRGSVLLHTARAQYENAILKQGNYFRVTLPEAPAQHQSDWGAYITRRINRVLKRSSPFYHIQDSVFGGVCLHGVGAKIWWDKHRWLPSFVGIQDILLPTDTELTLENVQFFAVRRKMRPGELFKKTLFNKPQNIDRGWNLEAVKKILQEYKELNTNPHNYDWSNNPEQMSELYKQNLNYYDGDSAPVIWFWDFYHLEEQGDSGKNGWYRKLMLDSDCVVGNLQTETPPFKFIYESKMPVADNIGQIIHFQFGDGNNIPPYMYHSIRSLAFMTYEILWTMNRLRCQWTQHVFEQMLTMFRIQDPGDRSRLQQIVMDSPWGILPEGLNMVTAQERYAVRPELVQGLAAEYKQMLSETSSSYTQKLDTGTQQERTKFEVEAILSQISALMGTMLSRAYNQEVHAYTEICRRFCMRNSDDFDVKKFQNDCKFYGIPAKYIDSDRWDVEVEQKLGGGNRMLEVAEASQLMERVNQFDPEAQQEIKHMWALAITNNPVMAKRLAPAGNVPEMADAVRIAEWTFNGLMNGIPSQPKDGDNHIVIVETMIKLMALTIQQINQSGGVGTQNQVIGLSMAAYYLEQQIAIIAQDQNEKERVKGYNDAIKNLMNQVKAFAQRQQEAMAQAGQNGNGDGIAAETQAKVAGRIIEAQAKSKIAEQNAAQKRQHKEMQFRQRMEQDGINTIAKIKRDNAMSIAKAFQSSAGKTPAEE